MNLNDWHGLYLTSSSHLKLIKYHERGKVDQNYIEPFIIGYVMRLSFDELVDELYDRPSEELARFAELAVKYSIERRRAEIAENIRDGRQAWKDGKLVATDDIDELLRSLDDVE